jgi:iron complex transport system ATP-binding protein
MLTIHLEKVSLGYGSKTILTDISLEARPGQMLGIIGPNGSGKSTLIRGMTRLIMPGSGQIFIDGRPINSMKHSELARLMAVVPQNAILPPLFTAIEIVLLGRTPHLGLFRYEGTKDLAIVENAMQITGTAHLADRKVGELSGGEKQRLVIARTLAQEPKIILMDEPTANLDINYQLEILDLIRHLRLEQKLIVIAALHDLNLAAQYCDHLVMLNHGKIYGQGTPETIVNKETIKEVYGADVYVYPHPVNKLPATLVVSQKDRDKPGKQLR